MSEMNTKLREKIELFEKKRTALLDEMDVLDEATLQARPIEGKWSVLEIVEHLVIAEREVLGGLRDYEDVVELKQGFKNSVLFRVVMAVLKFGVPVKVPSKKMLPKNELSLAEIREDWDENQEWFRGYIDGLDNVGLKKAVFVHPVAGPINVEQSIDMSIAHIDSHKKQIAKRLELIGTNQSR